MPLPINILEHFRFLFVLLAKKKMTKTAKTCIYKGCFLLKFQNFTKLGQKIGCGSVTQVRVVISVFRAVFLPQVGKKQKMLPIYSLTFIGFPLSNETGPLSKILVTKISGDGTLLWKILAIFHKIG